MRRVPMLAPAAQGSSSNVPPPALGTPPWRIRPSEAAGSVAAPSLGAQPPRVRAPPRRAASRVGLAVSEGCAARSSAASGSFSLAATQFMRSRRPRPTFSAVQPRSLA